MTSRFIAGNMTKYEAIVDEFTYLKFLYSRYANRYDLLYIAEPSRWAPYAMDYNSLLPSRIKAAILRVIDVYIEGGLYPLQMRQQMRGMDIPVGYVRVAKQSVQVLKVREVLVSFLMLSVGLLMAGILLSLSMLSKRPKAYAVKTNQGDEGKSSPPEKWAQKPRHPRQRLKPLPKRRKPDLRIENYDSDAASASSINMLENSPLDENSDVPQMHVNKVESSERVTEP